MLAAVAAVASRPSRCSVSEINEMTRSSEPGLILTYSDSSPSFVMISATYEPFGRTSQDTIYSCASSYTEESQTPTCSPQSKATVLDTNVTTPLVQVSEPSNDIAAPSSNAVTSPPPRPLVPQVDLSHSPQSHSPVRVHRFRLLQRRQSASTSMIRSWSTRHLVHLKSQVAAVVALTVSI